jgi:ankyrin repeat protein
MTKVTGALPSLAAAWSGVSPLRITWLGFAPLFNKCSIIRTFPNAEANIIGTTKPCNLSLCGSALPLERSILTTSACSYRTAPVLSVLLQHKADVNRQDDNGNTPLINAASNDHLKCIDLLMKYGADPKCKNHMGHDTWYFALLSESDDVLKIVSKH